MSTTYVRPAPKTNVYRFGVLWFWKCELYMCAGGRACTEEDANARAAEHVATH
jgi:hypothetical protein